jgi:hypothetical protein
VSRVFDKVYFTASDGPFLVPRWRYGLVCRGR